MFYYIYVFSILISISGLGLLIYCISTGYFTSISFTTQQPKEQINNIKQEYITNTYAYVSSFALNMRSGPSTSSSIIIQLKQNSRVQVINKTGNWWRIRFDRYEGYVNSLYLSNNPIPITR